ncbi:MAG TPA: PcfJ domain-containing protein [Polyangiales bacterium]
MSTDTFRRHTRACVDVATHLAFASLPKNSSRRSLFEHLLSIARQRSDLMANPPTTRHEVAQISALRSIVDFETELVRDPATWAGARGHPPRVVDSLTSHLFGRYPTPRFLASVWFGERTSARIARRRWFVAHARGQRFRSLDLPIAMTRRMEHIFLQTPDHLAIGPALRRAEVLGLGGTPALASAVLGTRLAEHFDDAGPWRDALAWLARCGDSVDIAQISPIVDYLHANLHAVDLRGRTFASVMRLVRDWHGWLARERAPLLRWCRSRWNEMVVPIEPAPDERRRAEWIIVELLDSRELATEGRRMHHCVSTYAHRCASRRSSIWSLRRRWCDDGSTESVLTIEVRPETRTIVQLRTYANGLPTRWQLELVRQWANREGLYFLRPERTSSFPIAA